MEKECINHKCPECQGSGDVLYRSEDGDYAGPCSFCGGEGIIKCWDCGGVANWLSVPGNFCDECMAKGEEEDENDIHREDNFMDMAHGLRA